MTIILPATAITGLFTSLFAIYAAVFGSSPTWYSFFTVGSFAFFAPVSYWIRKDSLLNSVLRRPWLLGVLYVTFVGISVLVEFYGRTLGNLWSYPYFGQGQVLLHVHFLGYPFAFLSVIALFEIVEHAFSAEMPSPGKRSGVAPSESPGKLLFVASVPIFLGPLVSVYLGGPWTAELGVIAMIAGTLFVDLAQNLAHRKSFLQRIFSGDYRCAIVVPLASWTAAFIHEVPNTFAKEWTYHNLPFTDSRVFGVNVVVFFLGWLFLTSVPVTIFRLLDDISGRLGIRGVRGLFKR